MPNPKLADEPQPEEVEKLASAVNVKRSSTELAGAPGLNKPEPKQRGPEEKPSAA